MQPAPLCKIASYDQATTVEFANHSIPIGQNGFKYSVSIANWPFVNYQNRLRIHIQSGATSTTPGDCASASAGADDAENLRWLQVNMGDVSLYGTFAEYALIDDASRVVQFSYATNGVVAVTIPHFWFQAEFDPSFQVLLNSRGTASDEPIGECGSSEVNGNSGGGVSGTVIGSVVGGVAGAAALVAAGLFAAHKRKQGYRRHLLASASSSVENARPRIGSHKAVSTNASSLYKEKERSNPIFVERSYGEL